MSARWVVVDDNSTDIRYSGSPWFLDVGNQDNVGNFGPPYRSTLHGTHEPAAFSFNFTGTKVGVFGLSNVTTNFGTANPSMNCFVDGKNITVTDPFPQQANNWLFCLHLNLLDGPHTLEVNTTVFDESTFWLDTVQYVPSPSSTTSNENWRIDENDEGLLYDSRWTMLYDRGFAFTNKTGATVNFEFTGTSLTWVGFSYAALPGINSTATYTIDDGAPHTFIVPGHPEPAEDHAGIRVFKTPTLANQKHNISVTFLGNETTTPLILDHLYIDNGTYIQNPPVPSTSSGAISSTVAPSGADSTSADVAQVTGAKKVNTGAVLAGVIPSSIIVLVLACFLYSLKLRRRRSQDDDPKVAPYDIEPTASYRSPATAFLSSNGHRPLSMGFHNEKLRLATEQSLSRSGTLVTSESGMFSALTKYTAHPSSLDAHITDSEAGPSRPSFATRTLSRLRPSMILAQSKTSPSIIRHEDSGLRGPEDALQEAAVELPPLYTAG